MLVTVVVLVDIMAADVLVELLSFRNYSHEQCEANLLALDAERYTAAGISVPCGRIVCKQCIW